MRTFQRVLASVAIILTLHFQASAQSSIVFNGTSASYATITTLNPSGNFSTGITMEAWVRWTAFTSANAKIFDFGNGATSNNITLGTSGTTSNLVLQVYNAATPSSITATTTLTAGRWYHIAATVTGSNLGTIYVDGVQVGSGTVNTPVNIARSLNYIGRSNNAADGYLNAQLDEVRVWNSARTTGQVFDAKLSNIALNAPGLVAYYKCDEGSGLAMANSGTNGGASSAAINAPSTWAGSPIQNIGNALRFDGADDFGTIANSVSGNFTIEFWMRATAAGVGTTTSQWFQGSGMVDAEVGGVTNDFGVTLTADRVAFGVGGGVGADVTIRSTSSVNTGNWVHVAATWNQTSRAMTLYVNGTQEATGFSTDMVARTAPTQIRFGGLQTGGQFFNGTLDDIRIWSVVRTPAQISANMNREVNPLTETNLVNYYVFNFGFSDGANAGMSGVHDIKGNNMGVLTNFALTGVGSNYTAQNVAVVLPLVWVDFTAKVAGTGNLLQWTTASEENVKSFSVEQSTDATSFKSIGELPAKGTTTGNQNYQFTHEKPAGTVNYYRIRQTDRDGKISYSKILSVRTKATDNTFALLNNVVVNGQARIDVKTKSLFSLYSNNGQLIWKKQLPEGVQTINVPSATSGVYILQAAGHKEKIVVQK